jgi:tetratricopeptide (TPR) repeat protein
MKRKLILLFCFFVLLCIFISLISSRISKKTDYSKLSKEEADLILAESIKNNDIETYSEINNEYYIEKIVVEASEKKKQQSIAKGDLFALLRSWRDRVHSRKSVGYMHWSRELNNPVLDSHPRLKEAAIIEYGKYGLIFSEGKISNIQTTSQPLMQLYDSQLLTGQALDHLWNLFLVTGNNDALADYLIKSTDTAIDTRGLDQTLSNYISGDPQNPIIQRALGLLRYSQGRFQEAVPLLQFAANNLQNDALGRYALAESKLALGQPIDPIEYMGKTDSDSLNFKTEEARRLFYLSKLFDRSGNSPEALKAANNSINLNPNDSEVLFYLVSLLKKTGDIAQSEEWSKKTNETNEKLTRLRKVAESWRKGNKDSAQARELIEMAKTFNLPDIARGWKIILEKRTPAEIITTMQAELSRKEPVADRFFLPRPQLKQENTENNKSGSSESQEIEIPAPSLSGIQFRAMDSSITKLQYQYLSFADPKELRIADVMGGGAIVADFNLDGHMDILFPGSWNLNDVADPKTKSTTKLYFARPAEEITSDNIEFIDVTDRSGLNENGYWMGAAVGDFNNDETPDIFMTGYGRSILFKNRGDGTFEDVTQKAGVLTDRWTTTAAFADLDADGDLDLYAVTYVDAPSANPEICLDNLNRHIHCSPGKFPAQPDLLWENLGNGTFRDISTESGIAIPPNGRGLGMAVADLDDDGRLDIFVANDASPNFYFHNEGGLKFTEKAAEAGLAVDGSGKATASMGVVAADLDEDGLIDIFHTNFINEPNTFRKNLGKGLFTDATFAAGLSASSLSRTGFGTVSFDADLDGHTDLFIAHGHLDDQPHIQTPMAQKPLFYRGLGKKGFQVIPENQIEYLTRNVVGRGMASADFNNDGRVDLLVVHRDDPAVLLKNESQISVKWLGITLVKNGSPPPAGTKIKVICNNKIQSTWAVPGTSYLSASDPRFVFGLDRKATEAVVEIYWPGTNGQPPRKQLFATKELNRYHTIDFNMADTDPE